MKNHLIIKKESLKDQRILFLGAGSAGIGIANLLAFFLQQEGLSKQEALSLIYLFDQKGLLESSRTDLLDFQKPYAHSHPSTNDLVFAIQSLKPTILIGVSTQGGAFTKQVVETLSHLNSRPIIFALSNPTEHAECTAEQAYEWSSGKALFAAGVQFDPVVYKGKTYFPGQANNFYIFPAVGMGILAAEAKKVNDEMFIEAAKAVADHVTAEQLSYGLLYPPQTDILNTALLTAERVAKNIFDQNLSRIKRPLNIKELIQSHI